MVYLISDLFASALKHWSFEAYSAKIFFSVEREWPPIFSRVE